MTPHGDHRPGARRLYRWLLRCHPAAFRDEYGDEMTTAFLDDLQRHGPWRVWPGAIADAIASAVRTQRDTTVRDVRFAVRGLTRAPAFAVVTLFVLALGIGATSAVATIVGQVLWSPLPYASPDRLGVVLQEGRFPVSPVQVNAATAGVSSFDRVDVAELWGPVWTGGVHPVQLRALRVSPSLFGTLGVPAAHGRTFTSSGDERSLVVSHAFWQTRLAGAADVIGRELVLDQASYTIVGVMPETFAFSPFWAEGELFVPLDLPARGNSRAGSLRAFVRLRDDATWPQARAELAAVTARLVEAAPEANDGTNLQTLPLQERVTGDVRPLLLALFAAVACALLITCVNTATLLLVRATRRDSEMAVRSALGAGSAALTRQLLTEGVVLAGAGTLAGLVLAWWLVSAAAGMTLPGVPRLESVRLDASTLGLTAALGLVTGLAFSLAPALWLRRRVRLGTRGTVESAGAGAIRRAFVVTQVALALVLVVGAGLFVRSFVRLTQVDPGFDVERVLTLQVSAIASPRWQDDRSALFDRLRERIDTVPGVAGTGVVNHLPLAGDAWGTRLFVEGRDDGERVRAVYRVASPGYVDTMRMTLRQGRDIQPGDARDAPGIVLVNRTFADVWLGRDAVGRRVSLTGANDPRRWVTVVGVVDDVKQQEWAAPVDPEVYVPVAQVAATAASMPPLVSATLVVRTIGDPLALAAETREAVWAIDGDLAVSDVLTLDQAVGAQLARPRAAGLIVGGFGVLALVLAVAGIYGVVAFDAGRRTREIGVRMALGARAGSVLGFVLARGVTLTGMGLVAGLAAALYLTRLLEAVLFATSVWDPLVFTGAVLVFLLVGLLASLAPAVRAARLDPVVALRSE